MTKRDRLLVLVLGGALVLGAAWMVLLKPQRAELASLTAKIEAEQGELDAARAQAAQARVARQRYAADYAVVARLGKAVPPDDDLPALLVQLQAAAEGSQIDFRSVKLVGTAAAAPGSGSTTSGQVAAVAGAQAGAGSAAEPAPAAGAAGPAPGASAAAAPATQSAAAGLPPGATVGPAGIATMPFTFAFEGSFLRMQAFLDRVQRFIAQRDGGLRVSGRLLTIDGIGIGPGEEGFPTVRATLTATAYVLPADQGLTAGASPALPAAGAPAPGMTAAPAAPAPAPATPIAAAQP